MKKRFGLLIVVLVLLVSFCITTISVAAEDSPLAEEIVSGVGRQAIEDYVKDHASISNLPEGYGFLWDGATLISTPGKDFLTAAQENDPELLSLLASTSHPTVSVPITEDSGKINRVLLLTYSYEEKEYRIGGMSSSDAYRAVHDREVLNALCQQSGITAEGYQPFILYLYAHPTAFILAYGETDLILDPAGILDRDTKTYTPESFAEAVQREKDTISRSNQKLLAETVRLFLGKLAIGLGILAAVLVAGTVTYILVIKKRKNS